ncbi:hypothetical protein LZG74_16965 [Dyadobacter sp. CY327]|uniref:hypothetical protein n=1 Tax=Dyadobacter sp. CY327 TaxID=2907301 RepID=UPI001F2BE644|nr:hypothetical protein [Dyadobacter sp. CY327]MCE7072010.1 hypothetical protein [Dyadobacter sp. CY327]
MSKGIEIEISDWARNQCATKSGSAEICQKFNNIFCNYLACQFNDADCRFLDNFSPAKASDVVWYSQVFNEILGKIANMPEGTRHLDLKEYQEFFFWDFNQLKKLIIITCEAFGCYNMDRDIASTLKNEEVKLSINLQNTILEIITDVHARNAREVCAYLEQIEAEKEKEKDPKKRGKAAATTNDPIAGF